MPAQDITQISYRYAKERVDTLNSQEVEGLIRESFPYSAKGVKTELRTTDQPYKKIPRFDEFWLLMEGRPDGLIAVFRPFMGGIEAEYTSAPPPTHGRRNYAAYIVSMTAGVEIVPITAVRDFREIANYRECAKGSDLWRLSKAGQGTLSAMINGTQIYGFDPNNFEVCLRTDVAYRSSSFVAALVFDILIGSGQRDFSSYLVDKESFVRSRYHHEAWTHTAQDRLEKILQEQPPEIQKAFWNALMSLREMPLKRNRLKDLLVGYVGLEKTTNFFKDLGKLLQTGSIAHVKLDPYQ
ncbi:MAG: hypothetical protein P1P90_00865 [Patescibacteria group bacterium]|nr:hypothetical protein [Patescibacteria group bacterium]